LNVKTLV